MTSHHIVPASAAFADPADFDSRTLEAVVLARLVRREELRKYIPERDLPPVPAELLVAAEWNLLPGPRRA